jgi:DUF4097 and DUF4098 domain-containing protein YvlB
MSRRSGRVAACLVTLLAAAPAAFAAETRAVERSFPAGTVRTLELENLAGRVTLVASTGALRVSGQISAEASAGKSAAALADSLQVEFVPTGDRLVVRANYPLGDHRRYHYPGSSDGRHDSGGSWLLGWLGDFGSNVRYQNREVRVVASPAGNAATLWADFRLELPPGVAVKVRNSVGTIESTAVGGDQVLDAASGDIAATGGRGKLLADTGSGDVAVRDHDGDVTVDTGSGDVTLEQVDGAQIAADTGSGNVSLLDCRGALLVDTGSGDIRGRGLTLAARLHADTGSGDVRLAGDFSAVTDLKIDTGSGDVVLDVRGAPSVHLRVSTGSGDIEVDLPDMRVRQVKGDFIADVAGARGQAQIDTGSGNVRIQG